MDWLKWLPRFGSFLSRAGLAVLTGGHKLAPNGHVAPHDCIVILTCLTPFGDHAPVGELSLVPPGNRRGWLGPQLAQAVATGKNAYCYNERCLKWPVAPEASR